MRFTAIALIFIPLFIFSACNKDDENTSENKIWYENIGSRTDLPFLPDAQVNYFMYSFKRKQGDKIGLRLTAEFPYARYMSYNIYDNRDRTSQASIVDKNIQALEGNENPFQTGNISTNRQYQIHILPNIPEAKGYENTLYFNDKITNLGSMLRLYVPEKDGKGGVALPKIEAFDLQTGATVDLPQALEIDFSSFTDLTKTFETVIGLSYLLQEPNKIDFFRFSGAGLYQNFDNQYLFAPIELNNNQVAILKVKPPTFAQNLIQIPEADVRYYSFCIGDAATYNYFTLPDFQCRIAADGYIYLVVGRDEPELKSKAEGLNYLVWDKILKSKGLIVYRNLLTKEGYPNNMLQVPDLVQNIDKVFDTAFLRAGTYLKEYAPQGIIMTKEAYLENFGGFEVAY
jgi:hypothetical protein